MLRSFWFTLMACAGLAVMACASPVPPVSNNTNALDIRVHGGGPLDSIVVRSDFPRSLEPRDLEELVRSLESEDLEILARSLEPEDLEERQVAQVVKGVVDVVEKVFNLVKDKIEKDKAARGQFTQHIVNEGLKAKPGFNWIICHTKHRTQWKGVRGKDWDHKHQEFDVSFGKTIGYEIYWAKGGDFWNEGDGGYLNWAYGGRWTQDPKNSKHLVFKG